MGQKSEEKERLTINAPNNSSSVVWAGSRRLCPPCCLFYLLEPIITLEFKLMFKKAKKKRKKDLLLPQTMSRLGSFSLSNSYPAMVPALIFFVAPQVVVGSDFVVLCK